MSTLTLKNLAARQVSKPLTANQMRNLLQSNHPLKKNIITRSVLANIAKQAARKARIETLTNSLRIRLENLEKNYLRAENAYKREWFRGGGGPGSNSPPIIPIPPTVIQNYINAARPLVPYLRKNNNNVTFLNYLRRIEAGEVLYPTIPITIGNDPRYRKGNEARYSSIWEAKQRERRRLLNSLNALARRSPDRYPRVTHAFPRLQRWWHGSP
jgi:hypothetical protein